MKSRASFWACVVGVTAIGAFLFYNLEWFPGLHGDEAWVGLYANRVKAFGLVSPHLMNDYTGAMFGWGVYRVFETIGTSVFALRLISVLCNIAAAAGFVFWAGRRFGSRGAVVMTGLLASSAMFLFYGRVAWEVCAFENILVLAILWSCRPFVEEGRYPFLHLVVFFAAIEFGVLNHFIFLSIPLSLAVYAAAAGSLLKDRRAAQLRPLFFTAALIGACCYCKRFVTPDVFAAHRAWFLAAFFGLPFFFAAVFKGSRLRERQFGFLDGTWPRRGLLAVTAAGSLAFCIWHLAPMVQIYSGVALMRRVLSLDPVWPLRWMLYGWGGALLSLFFFRLVEVVRSPSIAVEGAYARFILLWTGSYLAVFILLRHTSSIRYYLIMHALTLAAITVAGARLRFLSKPRIVAFAAVAVLGFHGFYWLEAATMPVRRPLIFRVGFRKDKSIDFIDKRELFARHDRDRICSWDHSKQDFLYIPAIFHRQGTPIDCDASKRVELEYCGACEKPPFYSYTLVKNE